MREEKRRRIQDDRIMSKKPNNPNERAEGMLRRWGADEASRKVELPEAPLPAGADDGRARTSWRWAPLVAAMVVLAAGAVLFFAAGREKRSIDLAYRAATLKLQAEHADRQRIEIELERTRRQLRLARGQADRAAEDTETSLARLREKLQGGFATALGVAETQITKLNAALKKQDEAAGVRLDGVKKQLALTGRKLSEAKGHSEKLEADIRELGRQLGAEIARLSKSHSEEILRGRKARRDLETLKARRALTWSDVQQAYLSALAPEALGLAARQAAADRSRLLRRCPQLHSTITSEPVGELVERLEVILTRLELLDPYEPGAGESIAALLAGGEVVAQIDEVLASGRESRPVRIWLLEARLVVAGAEHVG